MAQKEVPPDPDRVTVEPPGDEAPGGGSVRREFLRDAAIAGVSATTAGALLAEGASAHGKPAARHRPGEPRRGDPEGGELARYLSRTLVDPPLKAEPGFSVKLLVPPGEFYDPIFILPEGRGAIISDDGGRGDRSTGFRQGRIGRVDQNGRVTILTEAGRQELVIGIDRAPKSWGQYAGQLFTLAQVGSAAADLNKPHVVQVTDPKNGYTSSIFLTLPNANPRPPLPGQTGPGAEAREQGVAGGGWDANFGPKGSPFADKLFVTTTTNGVIYQVTPDRQATPFVEFEGELQSARNLSFTPDGNTMIAAVSLLENQYAVARISPQGEVESTFARVTSEPGDIGIFAAMVAPDNFGPYGGQLFLSAREGVQEPAPPTGWTKSQSPEFNGYIYRVTADGERHLVASGFWIVTDLAFIAGKLWAVNINVDYLFFNDAPSGFIAQMWPR